MVDEIDKKIEEYLTYPDVKVSNDTISLYDLYNIIDYHFSDLRHLQKSLKEFEEKINKDYCNNRLLYGLKHPFQKNQIYLDHYCHKINAIPKSNNEPAHIHLSFYHPIKEKHKEFKVYQNEADNNIYYCNNKQNQYFVQKYYEDINYIFEKIEKYSLNLSQKSTDSMNQYIKDDFFSIEINYDCNGKMNLIVSKNFNTVIVKPMTIQTYAMHIPIKIYNNTEVEKQFLRKIPVNIPELDDNLRPIVQDYLSMNNAPLLVKKR